LKASRGGATRIAHTQLRDDDIHLRDDDIHLRDDDIHLRDDDIHFADTPFVARYALER